IYKKELGPDITRTGSCLLSKYKDCQVSYTCLKCRRIVRKNIPAKTAIAVNIALMTAAGSVGTRPNPKII
ncbi:MAG: hypothetical protein KJ668_19375, partial [Proteobacteria bacterium]|nr:hypothetical protein [Pseudomonadota bacterium]